MKVLMAAAIFGISCGIYGCSNDAKFAGMPMAAAVAPAANPGITSTGDALPEQASSDDVKPEVESNQPTSLPTCTLTVSNLTLPSGGGNSNITISSPPGIVVATKTLFRVEATAARSPVVEGNQSISITTAFLGTVTNTKGSNTCTATVVVQPAGQTFVPPPPPPPLPVNGGWSAWSACSASCGGGTRTRSCNSSALALGEAPCQGAESEACNTQACVQYFPSIDGVPINFTITSGSIILTNFVTSTATCFNGCTMDKNNDGNFVSSQSYSAGDAIRLRVTSPSTKATELSVYARSGPSPTIDFKLGVRTVNATCGAGAKRIFVTKATYTGNLGGRAGADVKCQSAATGASLSGSWKALLAQTGAEATSRMSSGTTYCSMANTEIYQPGFVKVGSYERYEDNTAVVENKMWWIGDSYPANTYGCHCTDWTSEKLNGSFYPYGNNGGIFWYWGRVGQLTQTAFTRAWFGLESGGYGAKSCGDAMSLLCFEQ